MREVVDVILEVLAVGRQVKGPDDLKEASTLVEDVVDCCLNISEACVAGLLGLSGLIL